MFPRQQRLRTSRDILAVFRQGNRINYNLVTCSLLRKPATLTRIAVIVDTKVSKLATVRNLCRRRVRAILRKENLPAGDLIIRLRPGADKLPYLDLSNQITQCLNRLSLRK